MTAKIYHKSVRYRLHRIEINNYRPSTPGINLTTDNYDPENNEITMHYSCTDDPTLPPNQRRTIDDIEEEISRMSSRIVTESKIKYPNPFYLEVRSILDLPAYDGQYDKLRSKAKDVTSRTIEKSAFKDINRYYEKMGMKGLRNLNVEMGLVTY